MGEQLTNEHTVGSENLEDLYELSPMQQGMFFHSLYAPASGVYFEQSLLTIEGELDHDAFQRAWQRVVARHSILRTAVLWQGLEKPVQVVYRQLEFEIEQEDWRQLSGDEQHEQLEVFIRNDQARGFDLERAPLMRAALIRVADNVYKFLWSRHHLVVDRWSRALLLKEVFSFYNAFSRDLNLEIEPSRPYSDYVGWLLAQDRVAAEAFWRELLVGFASPTPFGFENHGAHGGEKKQYDYEGLRLPAEATSSLREFARKQKLTTNTLVQGAWALLLSRYSGEEDVLFGATVSGRPADLAGVEKMVGLFINTLPVRVKLSPESSLSSWLRSVQEQQSEQRQYEYSSLIDIQGWSEIPRGAPLFESILVFENLPVESVFHDAEGTIDIRGDRSIGSKTSYPLTVMVDPGAALSLQVVYDRDRFEAASINRLLHHFALLLQSFIGAEDRPLREISFLDEAELHRVLVEWNETTTPYEDAICLHQGFEEQVGRAGHAIALKHEDDAVSYAELNQRANKLARILVARGVRSEAVVGICLNRSIQTVIGILAILKAGGAYLPLDPAYPRERLQFMAGDSELTLLLTERSLVKKFAGTTAPVLLCDELQDELAAMSGENLGLNAEPDGLAYLMYTSGSTGRPKGVAATHRATMNRCCWMWRVYPFGADEVSCQKTSLSFVDSVWEIFGPLLQGTATVIIPDEILKDPFRFVETLGAHGVTRLVLVPSLLRVLLETVPELEQKLRRLKLWVTSGEALPADLVEKFTAQLPQSVLLNLYGSSEVAADVTCYQVAGAASSKSVPIGRPISNTEIYILDAQMQPVPIGVVGDLYVGGTNLARGYHKRADLTAERFVVHPFSKTGGGRLYRTGDLACYRPDGNIEYRGRVDNQVKLRGYRIELGEIEGTLRQHAGVADAVVVLREDQAGDARLVAYVVRSSEAALQTSELRSFLQRTLPEHMIPSMFVTMEALPLTPSGKVDRRNLPEPDQSSRDLDESLVMPRTALEEEVAKIWEQVLKVKGVGV
jgi:surfactin family lipopeptide synthetase C